MNFQKVVFLFSLLFAVILAQSDLGERCGRNNEGQKTPIDDCETGIIISNVIEANDKWTKSNNVVCCIKDFYLRRGSRSLRKSEQACNDFGPGIQRKVFPSTNVLQGEYQHNVILGYEKKPNYDEIEWNVCGGFLISENYILTAAHCLNSTRKGFPKMVRLGNIDLTGAEDGVKPQDIPISSMASHPDFNIFKRTGDIALLKLAKSVNFTKYVQPACLYAKDDVPASMVSTGWAVLNSNVTDRSLNDLLRKSSVTHVNQENCNQTYTGRILDSEFCGFTDTSICYQLSGSPAFIPNNENSRVTVVGFATRGSGCGHSTPNVYTKISSYLDWIESIVWP